MNKPIEIRVHPSQFPSAVSKELVRSLRARAINPKFHYESYKQTRKWLSLHQAYSPSRSDADCAAIYDAAFAAAASACAGESVHLVGLGCGGGQKDTRLLKLLAGPGRTLFYTPLDVSPAMVQVAALTAREVVPGARPVVADLQLATDLGSMLHSEPADTTLYTFLGMIPNFEPEMILPRLTEMVRPTDHLLFSANLAPGPDYKSGVERVVPLYNNELTRDWLMTLPLDLGFEAGDGEMGWEIEGSPFLRITAYLKLHRDRTIWFDSEEILFRSGESLRLFFSYRYAPRLIVDLLARHGLRVEQQWITKSEEEGVFLCRSTRQAE